MNSPCWQIIGKAIRLLKQAPDSEILPENLVISLCQSRSRLNGTILKGFANSERRQLPIYVTLTTIGQSLDHVLIESSAKVLGLECAVRIGDLFFPFERPGLLQDRSTAIATPDILIGLRGTI